MKTEELKDIIKETIYNQVKTAILEEVSEEVYIIKKDGEPVEQFETEEEAEKALEVYKKEHPDQELIIEKGKKLSFEELDAMSEKLENMENINETKHKGHFTVDQVNKLAKKAGTTISEAKDDLMELCEAYEGKVPAHRVFEILEDYDMSELKDKIKVKQEPKESSFTAPEVSMDEKLYGKQHKLDVDGDGEIEADDLAKLRAGETNEDEGECHECGDMKEGDDKKMCSECGSMLNEEGMCSECGTMMNETKKSVRLNESQLVELIKKMVNEAVPGIETYQKAHKESKSQNDDALSDVEKKIKEYLNFDGNDNPEFPHQIGGEVKARRADEKESDEVADNRGGGLEDLIYDVDPSKEAQERHEMALKGDTKMGNSQEAANVIPSKLGEKIIKKVKRKDKLEADMPMYNKDVQPIENVNESEEPKAIISEEIKRMKEMAAYNKKTQ